MSLYSHQYNYLLKKNFQFTDKISEKKKKKGIYCCDVWLTDVLQANVPTKEAIGVAE